MWAFRRHGLAGAEHSKLVSANTARRVKEAAERMGYVRNMFARSLAKGAARWICAAKASSALFSGLDDGFITGIAPVPLTHHIPTCPPWPKARQTLCGAPSETGSWK